MGIAVTHVTKGNNMSKFNIGDKVEVLEQSPFGIGIINVGDIVTVTGIRGSVLSLTNSKGDLQITRDDRGNLRRIPTREDIKKGDKVRILSCDSGRTDEVGQIVEVVAIMSSSLYPIYIKTEPDFTGAAFYGFEEVEKVEEEENVKQESRVEEAWEIFKETDEPVGQAKLYYKDNGEYFKKGYQAALQSEGVKKLVELVKMLHGEIEGDYLNADEHQEIRKALAEWEDSHEE